MMGNKGASYILRIQRDEIERQLYSLRVLYVSIKRDWLFSTKLLFLRKTAFIGSGIIHRFVPLGELREEEKKICLEKNYYGKIEFAILVRFYPSVALEGTSVAGRNILGLHGASMPYSDAVQIERLAKSKLTVY
ncbi:MAG: hypothetical protein M3261_01900 [Thermoproteota archaeon]|nr:hypothetical protein [Thermoproteota archaeon]